MNLHGSSIGTDDDDDGDDDNDDNDDDDDDGRHTLNLSILLKSGKVGRRPTVRDFLAFQIQISRFPLPWMPIVKPEEVVADALGVFPTTETTSSAVTHIIQNS